MKRGRRVLLLVATMLLVLAGCDPASPPRGTDRDDEESAQRFEPPPRVKPPAVRSTFSVKNLRKCLYREPIDPASIAGVYYGPIDLVAGQLEISRGIDVDIPSSVRMLDEKAFARAVAKDQVKLRESDELATRSLAWALGVAQQGFDVNRFLKGEGSGLIAGFYNPKTGSIVVEKEGKLDAEYVILAHELTHAATDDAFDLPEKEFDNIVDDSTLAASSVVEGDATLSEFRVSSRLAKPKAITKALRARMAYKNRFRTDRSEGVPYMLIDSALFPYQWGLSFACSVFRARGWKGVNRLYSHPPTTTAQILFPQRYLTGEKARKTRPLRRPRGAWRSRDRGEIGAAHLKAMFEAPGDNETQTMTRSLARASAWGGGTYEVWTRKNDKSEYAVGISLVERPGNPGLLCSSMNEWYETSFADAEPVLVADRTLEYEGQQQDAVIACPGRNVLFSTARSIEVARSLIPGLAAGADEETE